MSLLQSYCGLDTVATYRLWEVLSEQLKSKPSAAATYDQSRALMSPILYAMCRGLRVDRQALEALREHFQAQCRALEAFMDSLSKPLVDRVISLSSGQQVAWFLECLGATLPAPKNRDAANDWSISEDALESLAKSDPPLAPICHAVLHFRNYNTMLTRVLVPELVDADDRMRTSYNIAGTVTKRFSSSKNALWTGMNMQNIKRDEDEQATGHASIRSIFVADPGHKFLNIDLERADSWAVALEVFAATGDGRYLEACGARDLHTYVSKLIWPDLGWTGDEGHDIALAKSFFYRQYDYRFMAKKLQHGGNYLGKPWTLSQQMKVPLVLAQNGQAAYFREFPQIRKWHAIKAQELQTTGHLTNLFGWTRPFHSRLDNDATLREAIAFLGQSVTAEVINRALLRLWAAQIQMPGHFEFLAQVHDSVLLQYPEEAEAKAIDLALSVMAVPITVTSPAGQTLTRSIPLEASVGWNWAGLSAQNPDGLRKWKGSDPRSRSRVLGPAPNGQLSKRVTRLRAAA